MKKHLLLILAVAAVAWLAAPPAPAQDTAKKRPSSKTAVRFAIGDIHGDYESFIKLLGRLGLVDSKLNWSGASRELVQTGDIFDRGPGSRAAVELLMKLEGQAKKAGGKATTLIGNHEVMNLVGDLRYVDPREYASFAADETAALRAKKKTSILALGKTSAGLLKSNYYADFGSRMNEKIFPTAFPRGFFAHREAFSLRGRIGAWLMSRNTVYLKDRNLFVHGGISPRVSAILPAKINSSVKADLKAFLTATDQLEKLGVFDLSLGVHELFVLLAGERAAGAATHPKLAASFAAIERIKNTSLLFASDGPFWYRGLALGDEKAFAPEVKKILGLQDVDRIVIGHTQPPSLRIQGRFANSVIMIDTGMNQQVYMGRASALGFQPDGKLQVFE